MRASAGYAALALHKEEELAGGASHLSDCTHAATNGQRRCERHHAGSYVRLATVSANMSNNPRHTGAPRERRRRRRPRISWPVDTSLITTTTLLPPVEPPTGFAELGVPELIDAGLAAAGFAEPFQIQAAAIPVAIEGHDLCTGRL